MNKELTPEETIALIEEQGEPGALWYVVMPDGSLSSQHTQPSFYPPPFDTDEGYRVIVNGCMTLIPFVYSEDRQYVLALFINIGEAKLTPVEEPERTLS